MAPWRGIVVPMGRPRQRSRPLGAGFWTLWTAGAVSNLGDGVSYVAWPWLAGTLTRDPLAIAGLPVAARLPCSSCPPARSPTGSTGAG